MDVKEICVMVGAGIGTVGAVTNFVMNVRNGKKLKALEAEAVKIATMETVLDSALQKRGFQPVPVAVAVQPQVQTAPSVQPQAPQA